MSGAADNITLSVAVRGIRVSCHSCHGHIADRPGYFT
jgi:hypothetical protein